MRCIVGGMWIEEVCMGMGLDCGNLGAVGLVRCN